MNDHKLERKAFREECRDIERRIREATGPMKVHLEKYLAKFRCYRGHIPVSMDGFVGG